jgi:hypothetical protein
MEEWKSGRIEGCLLVVRHSEDDRWEDDGLAGASPSPAEPLFEFGGSLTLPKMKHLSKLLWLTTTFDVLH